MSVKQKGVSPSPNHSLHTNPHHETCLLYFPQLLCLSYLCMKKCIPFKLSEQHLRSPKQSFRKKFNSICNVLTLQSLLVYPILASLWLFCQCKSFCNPKCPCSYSS
uniref:Uncharacterized protein n=1 Tax=Anguilla anguilla TaxID=7936 RepID=A0A0E9W8P6_ANGAN